ncbi:hypothetical protein [Rhodococcus opacus]|uniref:hypothetical protein n=1 Tax=Rhodococcus opacus TaxID=37919 RepID=UPI001056FA97|nr:hypothetical protein [Rhodococcus opacus]
MEAESAGYPVVTGNLEENVPRYLGLDPAPEPAGYHQEETDGEEEDIEHNLQNLAGYQPFQSSEASSEGSEALLPAAQLHLHPARPVT